MQAVLATIPSSRSRNRSPRTRQHKLYRRLLCRVRKLSSKARIFHDLMIWLECLVFRLFSLVHKPAIKQAVICIYPVQYTGYG